jgi:AcrR family transcriptional regulator
MAKKNKSSAASLQKSSSLNSSPLTSKDRLLAAALEVFSQHGYHGTTTKMISVAAGVNEALISRHFISKQGLFVEVVKKNLIQEEADLPYPPQDHLADELVAFAKFIFKKDKEKTDFLKILIGHALQDEKFAKEMESQIALQISKSLIARLKILQQKKKVPKGVSLNAIEKVVKAQIFAGLFFSHLCVLHDEKTAIETMRFTLSHFATGLLSSN